MHILYTLLSMLSKKLILCIVVIIIISLLVFSSLKPLVHETFDPTSGTYLFDLLSHVGHIVYDSSMLSTDKIASLQKLSPPLSDTVINTYLNAGGDPDVIISEIKTYLGSCPKAMT